MKIRREFDEIFVYTKGSLENLSDTLLVTQIWSTENCVTKGVSTIPLFIHIVSLYRNGLASNFSWPILISRRLLIVYEKSNKNAKARTVSVRLDF